MISDKPWSVLAAARLFVAVIVTYCLGMLLASGVGYLKLPLSAVNLDALQMLIGSSFLELATIGWITVFVWMHGVGWRDAFGLLQSTPFKVALYGLVIGVLFLPIAWGLQGLSVYALKQAGVTAADQAAVITLADPNVNLAEKIGLGILGIVIAPVAEESLFRGILYPALKQRGWRGFAWWGTSILFAAMHVNLETFVPLMVFSLILIFLYEAYGNLLAPIMAHFVFNTANFLILMFSDQLQHLHLP